jgi:adenylate cyclase
MASFILDEGLILRYIVFLRRKSKTVHPTFLFVHTLIEVSFPSCLIAFMVFVKQMPIFVDSPVVFIYFLYVTLSILHLDYRLSFLTAIIAAVEYALIITFGLYFTPEASEVLPIPINSFYLRCIVLIITGFAGGFVADELKRRIQKTFELQRSKNEMEVLFGQQVSKEVLNALVEDRGLVRKQEATVLAMDIRNFSSFAESKSPDEIMEFQNKIFGPVIDIINQHQGVVNQILGDGIMATFGIPASNPLHADMAFEAALKIRKKIAELNQRGVIPKTKIGLGLHTGDVITGNIGNENRKQYSISGTAVIIAFRIEQLNKEFDSELLISEVVKNKIELGKVAITSLGMQPLKGFGYEIEVFKVA